MADFTVILGYIVDALLILSVIGALGTIITFTLFASIRTYPIKLIIYLCLTIFFGQSMFAGVFQFGITKEGPTVFCAVGGALVHYFFLSNFFWCFCIAFNFYQMIVKRNSGTRALEKWYHLVGWGSPAILVVCVAATGNYGQTLQWREDEDASGNCYIRDDLAVFLGFFLPGLIIVSANAVLFFFVASEIHGTLSKAPDTERRENTKEFRVLISIFVTVGLSWIFGFLVAILKDVIVVQYVFLVLFSITAPLQGFFIFVAYCINKKVINRWRNLFGKCCPCCSVNDQAATTATTASTRGGSTTASSRSNTSDRV